MCLKKEQLFGDWKRLVLTFDEFMRLVKVYEEFDRDKNKEVFALKISQIENEIDLRQENERKQPLSFG
jgi:hypothetical protein